MCKHLIIIQARVSSSRLPGKILKKINNTPIILLLIERLLQLNIDIIVATSKQKDDDKLYRLLKKYNIKTYRGHLENVFSRFYEISKIENYDKIIRITADNVLIDIQGIKHCLKNYTQFEYIDGIGPNGYVPGFGFEIIDSKCLMKYSNQIESTYDKEHVTTFFRRNKELINYIEFNNNLCKKKYKNYTFTVDTIADFESLKTFFDKKNIDHINFKNELLNK